MASDDIIRKMTQTLDVCRLCCQKKKIKIDIFDHRYNLVQKIRACLSMEITADDVLPKLICFECQRNVDQFNSFKINCRRAENKLRKLALLQASKTISSIKEEIIETAVTAVTDPYLEHNYGAPPANSTHMVPVKSELHMEEVPTPVISAESLLEKSASDVVKMHPNNDVIFLPSPPVEQKCPIVSVNLENTDYVNVGAGIVNHSKVEVELLPSDFKPIVTIPETLSAFSEPLIVYDTDDDVPDGEFLEEDLVLGENETCDIDMEEMDAIIQKKLNPALLFSCEVCKRQFKFFKGLRKHRASHQDFEAASYFCDICESKEGKKSEFSSRSPLKSHICNIHFPKDLFTCQLCGEQYRTKTKVFAHLKANHGYQQYTCNVCSKQFQRSGQLKMHMRVHSDAEHYSCQFCGKNFRWASSLKAHLSSHFQEKTYLCSECGKTITSKRNWIDHANAHKGIRPHICYLCGLSFTRGTNLSKHLVTHTVAIFRCQICGKNFKQESKLKQHCLTHSSEKPYSCPVCQLSFRSISTLNSHRQVHGKDNSCDVCGKKFNRREHLREHMVCHTGVKHSCPAPECNKSYTQRFPLTKHFRKHHPDLEIINRTNSRRYLTSKHEVDVAESIQYECRAKNEALLEIYEIL